MIVFLFSFPFLLLSVSAFTISAPPPRLTRSTLEALPVPSTFKGAAATVAAASAAGLTLKKVLDKGSRKYSDTSVATEYDAWTQDGILEYYWGEHIHLGYYNAAEMKAGYKKKNFIQAKYDFTSEMMRFGGLDGDILAKDNLKVLDVGCGVGGTTRYIAKRLTGKGSEVKGITLSPNQVKRAEEVSERIAD